MLRLIDVLLTVAPLLGAGLLYGMVFNRLPSRRAVLGIVLAELLLSGVLVWQSTTDSLRPHERYVPARVTGGSVVDGHGG